MPKKHTDPVNPLQPILDMLGRYLPVADLVSVTIGGTTVNLDLSKLDDPEAMAGMLEAEANKAWPDFTFGQ